jgi:hypothetical protein
MEHNSSWEASSFSYMQEIVLILWKLWADIRVYDCQCSELDQSISASHNVYLRSILVLPST